MPHGDNAVRDVVLRIPKTLGRRTTIAQARAALEDDHVHMLLIVEDGRLLGTVVRDDLLAADAGDEPALEHAVLAGRTVAPDLPVEEARALLLTRGVRRAAVLDADGRLLGLLCLKRRQTGWCSDDDVSCRAEDVSS